MPLQPPITKASGKAAPRPAIQFQDKFAAELIHLIVSFIPTDIPTSSTADLRACNQLSRAFRYATRSLLFSTIKLDADMKPADKHYFSRRVEQLAELIKSSEFGGPIAPLVQTLVIDCLELEAGDIQHGAGPLLYVITAIAAANQGSFSGKLREFIFYAPREFYNTVNSALWRAGLRLSSVASIRYLDLYGFKDIPVDNFYGCTFEYLGLTMCNFAANRVNIPRQDGGRAGTQPIIERLSWNASDSTANFGHLEELSLITPVSGSRLPEHMTTFILSLKSVEQTRMLDIPAAVLVNSHLATLYIDITEWIETRLQYEPVSQEVIDAFHIIPEVRFRVSDENASAAEMMWAIGSVLLSLAGITDTGVRDVDNGARIKRLHITIPPALFWPGEDDFRVQGHESGPMWHAEEAERFSAGLRQINAALRSGRYRNVEQTIIHLSGDMSGYENALESVGGSKDILLGGFREIFFGSPSGLWSLNMRPRLDAVQCYINGDKFQLEEPESDDDA